MDDGRRVVFAGYRVQHSSILGLQRAACATTRGHAGRVRGARHVDDVEVRALRLPYGGAKGGVRCDARALPLAELERLTRRFTSELLPIIGPQEDIPAPTCTNEQTMAWMMDTCSMQRGYAVPEIVTGKPIAIGGGCSARRRPARVS